MNRYQKLKAVQGLIQGLDEQTYRIDNHPDQEVKTAKMYDEVLTKFYNAVLEVLNLKEDNEKE